MAKNKEGEFNQALLQQMQEPITLRVERIEGAQRVPVDLSEFSPESDPPGTNLTREQVMEIESWIRENAGGGRHRASATDSAGVNMTWPFYYPPALYPRQDVPAPAQVQPHPAATPIGARRMVQPPQQPMAGWASPVPPWPAPQFPVNPSPWWPQPQPTSEKDDKVQALMLELERQRHAMEIQQLEFRHAAETSKLEDRLRALESRPPDDGLARKELEREREERRRESDQQQMMRMFERMEAAISANAQQQPKADPSVEMLKQQLVNMQDQMREDRHRAEMLALSERNRGSDPLAEAMKESARVNAEAARETARATVEMTNRFLGAMVNPLQMVEAVQRAAERSDGGVKAITEAAGSTVEMVVQAARAVTELGGGGGNPVLDAIRDGVAKASDVAKALVASKAEAAQAQAISDQTAFQRQRLEAYQQHQRQQATATAAVAPQLAADAAQSQPAVVENVVQMPTLDQREFGLLLPHVQKLREAARNGEMDAVEVAMAIYQGAVQAQAQGVKISAFRHLESGNLHDLVQLIIPGASTEFQEKVVSGLRSGLAVGQESEGSSDSDEE